MIDFWARVDESDVDDFVKTLALPDYMSHLKVAPFSIAEQASSATGREPLKLVCFGPGRLEDLALDPFECAAKLLASLSIGLDVEKIRVPTSGAVWTWGAFGPTHSFYDSASNEPKTEPERVATTDADVPKRAERFDDATLAAARKTVFDERRVVGDYLRVYFEPTESFDLEETFDARDAYVSVSRREMFLSWRVVKIYVEKRCRDLLISKRDKSTNFGKNDAEETRRESGENAATERVDETEPTAERVDFAWRKSFGTLDEEGGDAAIGLRWNENESEDGARPVGESFLDVVSKIVSNAETVSDEDWQDVVKKDFAEENEGVETDSAASSFRFAVDERRAMFQFGAIAGAIDVDSSEFIEAAARFAGLTRSLARLGDYVRFDAELYPPRINGLGLLVKLETTPKSDDGAASRRR